MNQELLAGCPTIRTFSCSPWAVGPHAQTFFGVVKLGPRPEPRKELVTMPDGVQVILLWFEPKDAEGDAPLVISLHGIGGDEDSVRPIVLAEECMRRGWRSVLYVRRGHGNSSLLPVGTPSPPPPPAAGSGRGGPGKSAAGALAAAAGASVAGDDSGNLKASTAVTAVAAAAAATLDLPWPSTPPPAVATITVLAADGGDGDNSDDVTCPSCTDSPTRCLPKSLSLLGLHGGTGAAAAAGVSTAAAVDLEAIRRTRKAFPQHADTEDFQVVLQHIRAARPQALMVAVGFSMGSNALVRFLGEHPPPPHPHTAPPAPAPAPTAAVPPPAGAPAADGATASGGLAARGGGVRGADSWRRWRAEEDPKNPLVAAVSVSNGYDIVEGTRHLVSSRPLADRIITGALHKLLRRRLPEVHAICAAHGLLVDLNEVLACNTIREFEAALMLPICGHTDVDEYYRHNNCKDALMDVRTPLLCLSARDDPIIEPSLLRHAEAAAAANPHLLLAVTQRGGHLGWLQGWAGRSWMMQVILEFVQSVARLHGAEQDAAAPAAAPAGRGAGARTAPILVPATTGGDQTPGSSESRPAPQCGSGTRAVTPGSGDRRRPSERSVDVEVSASASPSPGAAAAAVAAAVAAAAPATLHDVVIGLD